jgi:hypothetical protein
MTERGAVSVYQGLEPALQQLVDDIVEAGASADEHRRAVIIASYCAAMAELRKFDPGFWTAGRIAQITGAAMERWNPAHRAAGPETLTFH